ncbi:MAG TPA: hypothetical protein VK004_04550, partial [Ignavibacteria bacterium]|nr:hypothetical protein [Ignavibacteria bacterium]
LGNEIIYHFFSVEKNANNFSVELPDANVENELEYWNKDFSLIKNRHDSFNLREFLVDRNIDSSIFKDCIDFLVISDLQLINKPPGSTYILMKFNDGSGFIYYPEIDSHHTFEERGWKLDDHWYYYDENY